MHNFSDLTTTIDQTLASVVPWLHSQQLPSGEFPMYHGRVVDGQRQWVPDPCVFTTALLAESLLALPKSDLREEMLEKTCDFLEAQAERGPTWSHFPIGHGFRTFVGPDADDTACVASVLRARGRTALLGNTEKLLLLNRNRRGLFHTWFVTRPTWTLDRDYWKVVLGEWRHPRVNLAYWLNPATESVRDGIDGVVNSNALFYLGTDPALSPVVDHLVGIVARGEEIRCDLWYRDRAVVFYFFARLFSRGFSGFEPARQPMIDRLRADLQRNGQIGDSAMETAMAGSALLHLGVAPESLAPSVRFLLESRLPESGWPRAPIYYGGPSKLSAWGSEELSAAFCVEFLARWQNAMSRL